MLYCTQPQLSSPDVLMVLFDLGLNGTCQCIQCRPSHTCKCYVCLVFSNQGHPWQGEGNWWASLAAGCFSNTLLQLKVHPTKDKKVTNVGSSAGGSSLRWIMMMIDLPIVAIQLGFTIEKFQFWLQMALAVYQGGQYRMLICWMVMWLRSQIHVGVGQLPV